MKLNQVAVIGVGKLGNLIVGRLISEGLYEPSRIFLTRGDKSRLAELETRFPGCHVVSSIQEAAESAELLILAVKPDQVEDVSRQLRVEPNQLIVSVVTKKSLSTITRLFGTDQVARCNTGIMLAEGRALSFWQGSAQLTEANRQICLRLITSWGEEFETKSEKELDIATIACGCLPAFEMYFHQALIDGLSSLGWESEVAQEIVPSVARAALERAAAQNLSPAQLIAQVKTGKGVTAATLDCWDSRELGAIVAEGMQAAWKRMEEM